MEEINISNKTNKKYILNNNILEEFGNIGEPLDFSRKKDIREYIYHIVISKSNWVERLEDEKNVFEFCLKSGLLTEIK